MNKKMYTRNIWITLWAILYVISLTVDCYTTLANKGLEIMGNQYYR